jgi:translocation and assembly module TamA
MKYLTKIFLIILLFHGNIAQAFTESIIRKIIGDEGVKYEININGIEDELSKKLELESIALEAIDANNTPKNLDQLSSISGLMAGRINDMLQAEGYYDSRTRANVINNDKPTLQFEIKLGKPYIFKAHEIIWQTPPPRPDDAKRTFPKTIIRNGLLINSPINNSIILATANDIQQRLIKDRCYISLQVKPKLILDRLTNQAIINFKVEHEGEANFGKVHFSGTSKVKTNVLNNYIKWEEGKCFNPQKLDETAQLMLQSRLLAKANIEIDRENIQNNAVPINIEVADRPHRTIIAGGSFATDEGIGTRIGWEHHNLFGKAHNLTTRLTLTGRERSASGQYTIPFFRQKNQNLQISSSFKQEETNAFNSTNITALGALERYIINPKWLVGAGGGLRIANIEDAQGKQDFAFAYAPIFMQWDSRDDYFDAKDGILTRGSITPYLNVKAAGNNFIKSEISSNIYLSVNELYHEYFISPEVISEDITDEDIPELLPYQPIIAIRGFYGQINGITREDIPADLRFYSGGGGSVRGYNFQAIGEREAGLAAGGTIKSEINAELRLRFNQKYGGVAFIDAGNVYNSNFFSINEKLFFAAGIGARYFSPIGVLRFDIATPLDKVQDKTNFGVYISIGQAF